MIFEYFLVGILGLLFGSFLTSFTDRIMLGELLPKGRSRCPKCKKQIVWHDNIPLFSYILLHGKCRNCKKRISLRYPIIEISTFSLFLAIFTFQDTVFKGGTWELVFLFFISYLLLAIFIIDLEHQIIPDELSFTIFVVSFLFVLFTRGDLFWVHMLSGFLASLFLLLLHLGTRGRGMGLGDVKLAIGVGILLGWPLTLTWIFMSFIIGAILGLILMISGKVRIGMHIPFGPFLVVSFFMVLFWGDTITNIVMPYL